MIRAFRYRLHPTRAQARTLVQWIDGTRELYNAALEERRNAWKKGVRVTRIDQGAQIPEIRSNREDMAKIPVLVLRGALHQIDRAFLRFFADCKAGRRPGYPRFRPRGKMNSISVMSFKDIGKSPFVAGGTRIKIPLLGKIKLRLHRPIEGTIKAMHIKLHPDGKWYIIFVCDGVTYNTLPLTGKEVGIDLGITQLIATSDGDFFTNPRSRTRAKLALARAQRRTRKRKLGSQRQHQARRWFAKHHAHVTNIRREQHIVIAQRLVTKYDTIFIEDLDIDRSRLGLARGMLAKHVRDASWGYFLKWLHDKAESAGRTIIKVNPRGTSQTCSDCGVIVKKDLSTRVHKCTDCGLILDRDTNAARNILGAGMALRRDALLVERRRRPAKVKSTHRELLGSCGEK